MRRLLVLIPAVAIPLAALCHAGAPRSTISVGLWDAARAPASVRVTGARLAVPDGGSGRVWTVAASRDRVRITPGGREAPRVVLRADGMMTVAGGVSRVTAPGELTLTARRGRLRGVLAIPLEEYVARVVSREMPSDWPAGVLAAQAVAARSFAVASRGRHASEGFDVCSLTHCQLWSASPPSPQARQAVRMTEGRILTIGGKPLRAPFCSTCGGHTADGAAAGLAAGCVAAPDGPPGGEFCRASPHFRWQARLSPADLGRLAGLPAGRGASLEVLERDRGGRVTRARVGTVQMDGGELLMRCGRTFGWARVKSSLFTVRRDGRDTVLDGRGLGHGAGLCQWGARGRALRGQDWQQILRAYFPEAELVRW